METYFTIENAPYTWLALGALFLAFEAFGATGIGFLFAGLAAIITALLAHLGFADTVWGQTAYFFALTVLWAILLWVPLQKVKAHRGENLDSFNNMVGDDVSVVEGDLEPKKAGKVKWSGTVMSAKLAEGEEAIKEGETAVIKEVKGTILIVAAE